MSLIAKTVRETNRRMAGPDHAVITLTGGGGLFRREPCQGCPWRVDNVGLFPAQAFKHSAPTAYDMAAHVFACHESGQVKPATCAGFLLRNADNNLGVRMNVARGDIDFSQLSDGGHELHASYRAMAVANGVNPRAQVLKLCRNNQGNFE